MNRRLNEPYIRATQLIGFEEIVEDGGVKLSTLLTEVGLDADANEDANGMIAYRKFAALMELAAVRLKRPSFGLELALRTPEHFPNLGPIALLSSFVSTYEQWIEATIAYWRYHTNAFTMQLLAEREKGLVVARYQGDVFAQPARQFCEAAVANICALSRNAVGHPDANPALIRLQHAAPKDTSLHASIFRCPVEFNADHTEILFDSKYLAYETKSNLRFLKPFISLYLKHKIDRTKVYDSSTTATVTAAVQSLLGTGNCSLETVADALSIHSKALQRKLVDEGTSFSDILQYVRENIARRLLVESEIPVERLAGLLDYASTPPFTLAFKRWTGETPFEYRKSRRQVGACSGSNT